MKMKRKGSDKDMGVFDPATGKMWEGYGVKGKGYGAKSDVSPKSTVGLRLTPYPDASESTPARDSDGDYDND